MKGDYSGTLDLVTRRSADSGNAIEYGVEAMSYQSLLASARTVAQSLEKHSGRVGLVIGEPMQTMINYLGILLSGNSVVPISPKAPDARNSKILRAANVGRLVVDATTSTDRARWNSMAVMPTDESRRSSAKYDEAYLLFTSGSTGAPKGVPISWTNVDAYIVHAAKRYDLNEKARVSHTFELTFDVAVLDILGAWSSGATLVIPANHEELMAPDYIINRKITHYFAVPSAVSRADRMHLLEDRRMTSLRWSSFIGEPFPQRMAEVWLASASGSVENSYGPTELTIACGGYVIPRESVDTFNHTVPIGEYYSHMEFILLDENRNLAEFEGELCMRGPQRFSGYLDPAMNNGRFARLLPGGGVAISNGDIDERDFYRTGDRVKRDALGWIHAGRVDRQVKVRGFRIELGEIEGALRSLPGVSEAAVVVESVRGERELFAVVTCSSMSSNDVKRLLNELLPEYMIPKQVLIVDQLPLNSNGKTDYASVSDLVTRRESAR